MELYAAIDLHSNNSFLVVINEKDETLYEKRLPNDLETIIKVLKPFTHHLTGLAIESTYNWYWLVDGLMEAGFSIHLVNTTAAKQYDGLKFADDKHDARWLAHLLRLNILPTGYIYPKEQRALRDLLRDRMRLVQQRTTHLVSIHCRLARLTGRSFSCDHISRMTPDRFAKQVPNNNNCMALVAHHAVAMELSKAITQIENTLLAQIKTQDCYQRLQTITGIGPILGMMIFLETGDITRFDKAGNYASYCRCVCAIRKSNGKIKGYGNRKNGNRYLAWAYIEAANYIIQHSKKAKAYYQKKSQKTKPVIARKAIAHKLAKACFYVLRDGVPFDENRLFV